MRKKISLFQETHVRQRTPSAGKHKTAAFRLLFIVFTFCMVLTLLPVAAAAQNQPADYLIVNGHTLTDGLLNPSTGLFILGDGSLAKTGTLDGISAVAQFDPATGTLTLWNYNYGPIRVNNAHKYASDLIIKLKGTNTVTASDSGPALVYAINNEYGGNITVTADAAASLTLNATSSGNAAAVGITTGYGINSGDVIIGGRANVTVNAKNTAATAADGFSYGIYANGAVYVSGNASLSIICSSVTTEGYVPTAGIYSTRPCAINTTGNVTIDCSANARTSHALYNTGTFSLLKVGLMTLKWATAAGAPYSGALNYNAANFNVGRNDTTRTMIFRYGAQQLTFVDNAAYNIPAMMVGAAITPIDLSSGVSGGYGAKTYSATGLPAGIGIHSSTGVISGTPTTLREEMSATIRVTDADGAYAEIQISVGEVRPAASVLSGGSVVRTSHTAATIGFTTTEAGTAYYYVTGSGTDSLFPSQIELAGTSLGAVSAGAVSGKAVVLTEGNRDIHVMVKNGDVYSNVLTIPAAAPDTTAPVPGNSGTITTADVMHNSLTLDWTKASDDTTAQSALKYYVYQKESAFTISGGLPTDGTLLNSGGTADIAAYDVTSLTESTTYYFIVVVEDEAGNKAAYTAASETTEAAPAGALTGTATISNTAPKVGDTLIGTYTPGNNNGTLTYTWKADGSIVGSGISYTVQAADLGKTITLEISSSVETGSVISAATAPVAAPLTDVIFSAVQAGGTSGTADSTGIVLTFNQSVADLTAGDITVTGGTGAAVKGTLTGSGAIWTIGLDSVTTEGDVTVSVADFDTFSVATPPQTVAVYKDTTIPLTDVTFSAEQAGGASGTADSTGIVLTFNRTVADLTADSITVADDTGAVVKGALTGSGTSWTIGLASVTTEGDVTVSVADFDTFHVATTPQTVAVYKDTTIPLTDVTFSAEQAGGASGTADSTGIVLTFNQSVADMTADNITIADDTGAAVKGALTGSGAIWTIGLASVTTEGNVTVSVADFGAFSVVTTPQSVAVYKDTTVPLTDVTFSAEQAGGASGTVDSTGIVLTFNRTVTDLTADNITIADDTGAAVKGALTGSGASWTIGLDSVTTEGDVTVSVADFGAFHAATASQTVAVYKDTTTPLTEVIFSAVETGGASGTADSTGIVLTFNQSVTGLTAGDVTISDDTGAAVKGALTGSGAIWTIGLASVTTEGDVTVNVADFGAFSVATASQTVAVYKDNAVTPTVTPTVPPTTPTTPPTISPASGDGGSTQNSFRVLFETSGGGYVAPVTGLSYGDRITAPANPVREGYTFGGWYRNEACTIAWTSSDAVPGDMTLYAKWNSSAAPTVTTTAAATTSPTVITTTTPTVTTTMTATAAESPAATEAPAPVFGVLAGLGAAGVLIRKRLL